MSKVQVCDVIMRKLYTESVWSTTQTSRIIVRNSHPPPPKKKKEIKKEIIILKN